MSGTHLSSLVLVILICAGTLLSVMLVVKLGQVGTYVRNKFQTKRWLCRNISKKK